MDASGQSPALFRVARAILPRVRALVLVLAIGAFGVALMAGGRGGGTSPVPARAGTLGAPVALRATATLAPFEVTLSWSSPASPTAVVGYKVFRDNLQIAAVPLGTTTYTDRNVFPGRLFTYQVVSSGEGLAQSERATTQIALPVPPIGAAQVAGDFNVEAVTVSQHGFRGSLSKLTMGWNLTPACGTSACAVVWRDLTESTLATTLDRRGATYSGSDRGKFLGRCGSVVTEGTVTISFRVTKADEVGNEWRATKLVGTIGTAIPSQLGCVSAGATLSFTATLVG